MSVLSIGKNFVEVLIESSKETKTEIETILLKNEDEEACNYRQISI